MGRWPALDEEEDYRDASNCFIMVFSEIGAAKKIVLPGLNTPPHLVEIILSASFTCAVDSVQNEAAYGYNDKPPGDSRDRR